MLGLFGFGLRLLGHFLLFRLAALWRSFGFRRCCGRLLGFIYARLTGFSVHRSCLVSRFFRLGIFLVLLAAFRFAFCWR